MKTASRHTLGASLALLALFSCGGGSGGGGSSGVLEGTWFGAGVDGGGVVMTVVIDDSNKITDILIDGQSENVTGTIQWVQSRIFEFVLSDGTEGGLVVDDALAHAILLDEFERMAVLEKGAVGLPAYVESDMFDAQYAGLTAFLDASLNLDEVVDTQLTVNADGSFNGSDSGGNSFINQVNGELRLLDQVYGLWGGTYDSNGPAGASEGIGYLFLTPDKEFVGALVCDQAVTTVLECGFGAWPEQ